MTVAAMLRHKGHEVASVSPTDKIVDVSELLSRRRIGAAVVMDAAEQLLGIVSERDIVHAIAANGARALEMTAGQLMTRALRTVSPETTALEAMSLMTEGRFRHLPVLRHDKLVGIVSIGDVVKARMLQQDHEVDSLRAYVAGSA